jgi:kinesin family protein 11
VFAESTLQDSNCCSISNETVTVTSRVRDAPPKSFNFDGTFTENADNRTVYEAVVQPLVKAALEGYNATLFAYGATGTGKTFTMEGGLEGGAAWSADHPESGMISRAVRDVFAHLNAQVDSENSVRVSHLELANEELVDLLATSEEKPLRLFEHPKEGVQIHNLESVPVSSVESIFKILRQSNLRRAAAATKLNASSSRSHCVFTITVQTKETAADGELIRVGRLHLIDLAGSENVAKSGTDKTSTGNINQSLLVLSRVIMALAENRAHVPYVAVRAALVFSLTCHLSQVPRVQADAADGRLAGRQAPHGDDWLHHARGLLVRRDHGDARVRHGGQEDQEQARAECARLQEGRDQGVPQRD